METTQQNSPRTQSDQDTKNFAQIHAVHQALKVRPMTMKEVDVFTGVMRENCCRYFNELIRNGKIALIRKRKCSVTGHENVGEYTANRSLFPKSNQLKIF